MMQANHEANNNAVLDIDKPSIMVNTDKVLVTTYNVSSSEQARKQWDKVDPAMAREFGKGKYHGPDADNAMPTISRSMSSHRTACATLSRNA